MQYTPPALAGVPAATLQVWLTASQTALHQLLTGARVATASYGQGDGNRSVTFSRTDQQTLRAYIGDLQRALGIQVAPRRPIRVHL